MTEVYAKRNGIGAENLLYNALVRSILISDELGAMGPLQFMITWYKNRHAGEQTAHWDIQNKRILS